MGIINSNLTKLGSFLGNEKLYIPEYQRGYSWEETQLDDFWLDLEQIYEENTHDEHFLGQVVIHKNKEDGKRYIIDGQQRISTTIIFLDILQTIRGLIFLKIAKFSSISNFRSVSFRPH